MLVGDVAVGKIAHLLGVRQAIAGDGPQSVLQSHHGLVAQFDVARADVAVVVVGDAGIKGLFDGFELLLHLGAALAQFGDQLLVLQQGPQAGNAAQFAVNLGQSFGGGIQVAGRWFARELLFCFGEQCQ